MMMSKGQSKTKEENSMDYSSLIKEAIIARKLAYAPYSSFFVGAALLTKKGEIYTGCNIENAAFTPTNCGERTAFFKGVAAGEREFEAIAVVGGPGQNLEGPFDYVFPCGVCRQVIGEFCSGDFKIIVAKSVEEYKVYLFSELLPHFFGPKDLAADQGDDLADGEEMIK